MKIRPTQIVESESGGGIQEEFVSCRIAQLLALVVVGLGLVAGASWWFGTWQALAFGADHLAMAPASAFLFVLLGASLFASSRWPFAPVPRIFNTCSLFVVVFLSLLLGGQAIVGNPVFEHWLVGDAGSSMGMPVGHISPLAYLAFLFVSVAFFCKWSVLQRRPVCLLTSVVFSWSVFLLSEMTLIEYASGSPPVLGNSKTALAALTAFAFMLTSLAILLPSLTEVRLFQLPAGAKSDESVRWVAAVAVICVVIAAVVRDAIVGTGAGDILPYVTFYPAVLIVALSTGLAGGLLATSLAGIYVQAWLHGGALSGTEWLALTVFLIGSTITSLICEATRQSLVRENRAGQQLKLMLAEQERAAQALEQSEEKFRALFEQAGGYCMILDPNTADGIPIIVDANKAACAVHGYEREEFVGRTVADICAEDGKRLVKQRTAEMMTGRPFHTQDRRVRKNGTIFTVDLNAKRIDIGGEPPLILTTEYDITEREELYQRIEKIALHVPGMIFQYQQWPDGRAVFPYASAGIQSIYGVTPADVAKDASAVFAVVHPEDRSRVEAKIAISMQELTAWHDSYRVKRRDGRVIWVEGESSPERQPDGSVLWHGAVRDITARKQADNELRLAASVFAHTLEGIVITDAENRIVEANPAFSAITGYERGSVLGKNPSILASGQHDEVFYREMWEAISLKGFWRGEIWNRRKNGEIYPELLSISAVQHADKSVQNYIAVFSDIGQVKAHEAELDRIANYDHLTGLPNRRLLGDRLEQAIAITRRSGRRMAVCYLDLDGFKPINDQFGHDVGDQLLIAVAKQLRRVVRAEDTVARLGGDEFVLLFNDLVRVEDSHALLERVLAAAASPFVFKGVAHRVSASIGVTLCPPDVDSADILLRHADQAMYRAKDAGRNRYHFYDAEQDQLIQNRRLKLQRIKEALARQEFLLYYQPKVDMVRREVIGVEALIRWLHPEDGLMLPAAFLPVTEGSELEIAIGEWVITEALTQVAAWQRVGLNLPVSVNISAGHLLHPSFPQRLETLLSQHPGCEPGCLEMEILETSALSDIERAGQTLTSCRALGVRFAMDDFGTGYSSLAYFRRLPIDVLKVDQSFVRDMLDDPEDMEIVESVVRLAHAFNRAVIAEGVETPEHGALLTLLGCQLGQGFGIARPMPADAIPAWVATWPEQGERMVVDQGINKEDIPLMMAMQNHRHWVDEFVDAFSDSDLSRLAEIERIPCRFGRWYQGGGANRYGKLDAFGVIGQSHDTVHELARSMVTLAEQGELESARTRLPSLFNARDELLSHLEALIDQRHRAGE